MATENGPPATGWTKIDNAVIERIHELGLTEFAVYATLAKHTDANRTCYPKVETIGAIVGVKRRAVQKALRKLEQLQLITTTSGARSNYYTLLTPPSSTGAPGCTGASTCAPGAHQDARLGAHQDAPRTRTREQDPLNKKREASPHASSEGVNELVEKWNAIPGVGHVKKITDGRRRAYRARAKDSDWLESLDPAMEKVKASAFMQGQNDRGWKADLDFFLRPDTVTKIMEGKYDDRKGHNQAGSGRRSGGPMGDQHPSRHRERDYSHLMQVAEPPAS